MQITISNTMIRIRIKGTVNMIKISSTTIKELTTKIIMLISITKTMVIMLMKVIKKHMVKTIKTMNNTTIITTNMTPMLQE